MTNRFQISIPRTDAESLAFEIGPGDVVYMLGANGTGKSSLVSKLYIANLPNTKRILAHRQMWFQSNSPNLTPTNREKTEDNIRNYDAQTSSRYYLEFGPQRTSISLYDLIDADTMHWREVGLLMADGKEAEARSKSKDPSPITQINELMRLSNLPINLTIEKHQKIVATKSGGAPYSIAELSDGERSALLIAADVLTAKPGTLLLIDEPERHLHRSIISPLLRQLFDMRKDCAFVISTHEPMLPFDTLNAETLLVRDCKYNGSNVSSWTVDKLGPSAEIDDELKRDILGARQKIIFVEGKATSLDFPLYSLLFPGVSIIPKESCRDVEHAVRGLRSAKNVHWIEVWGIVDNDQRSPEDIAKLRDAGVWALSHYSVESLYYHSKIIAGVALRASGLHGASSQALALAGRIGGKQGANLARDHLIATAVVRSARQMLMRSLPTRDDIDESGVIKLSIDVPALRAAEIARFDALISDNDWDGLLALYPVRESPAFDRAARAMKFPDKATYQEAVLKMLQEDEKALAGMRELLGDLYVEVTKESAKRP